jgi:hypothetical protein
MCSLSGCERLLLQVSDEMLTAITAAMARHHCYGWSCARVCSRMGTGKKVESLLSSSHWGLTGRIWWGAGIHAEIWLCPPRLTGHSGGEWVWNPEIMAAQLRAAPAHCTSIQTLPDERTIGLKCWCQSCGSQTGRQNVQLTHFLSFLQCGKHFMKSCAVAQFISSLLWEDWYKMSSAYLFIATPPGMTSSCFLSILLLFTQTRSKRRQACQSVVVDL